VCGSLRERGRLMDDGGFDLDLDAVDRLNQAADPAG
jgi:hypothetical protein